MRAALPVTALTLLALTGCATSGAGTPTETVTVTVTPSASPSPTVTATAVTTVREDLDAWAQEIEATIVERNGTWEEQCQEADFPVSACFITGLGADGADMLTVTLDLTPEKVPGLEIPFEDYRQVQAEEAYLTIGHAYRQIDELSDRPEQIRVYDAATEDMIGFADSDNGGPWEWHGGY